MNLLQTIADDRIFPHPLILSSEATKIRTFFTPSTGPYDLGKRANLQDTDLFNQYGPNILSLLSIHLIMLSVTAAREASFNHPFLEKP
jgi:hypothetical protein